MCFGIASVSGQKLIKWRCWIHPIGILDDRGVSFRLLFFVPNLAWHQLFSGRSYFIPLLDYVSGFVYFLFCTVWNSSFLTFPLGSTIAKLLVSSFISFFVAIQTDMCKRHFFYSRICWFWDNAFVQHWVQLVEHGILIWKSWV